MALLEFGDEVQQARILVIGVGGAGGNAINTMISSRLDGVEFVSANTDCQALDANLAPTKIQLGSATTRGLGAGANPDVGAAAATESEDRIREVVRSADMVFVTAGMGGGTGTGAAPVIARVARECGALTVGVVTKPFQFEGRRRARQAEAGITRLREHVDTLVTIPNQRLVTLAAQATTMLEAFRRADDVLLNAVQGISDLITVHGLVNVDFADVATIMTNMGPALMGTGRAAGERRAVEAARQAISSPLLEDVSIEGATAILINITGGPDLGLHEINEAATMIEEAAHEDANIIFGSVVDEKMRDEVRVTVIATGFNGPHAAVAARPAAAAPAPTPTPRVQAPAAQTTLPYGLSSYLRRPEPVEAAPPPAPILAPAPVVAPRRSPSGEHAAQTGAPVRRSPSGEYAAVQGAVAPRRSPSGDWGVAPRFDDTEQEAAAQVALAQGSGPNLGSEIPVVVPPPPPRPRRPTIPPANNGRSLTSQALAGIELDDELDIPAYIRRQNPPQS